VQARVAAIGRVAAMPLAVLSDAAASPEVLRFASSKLSAGPERDAVVAWAQGESEAAKRGGRSDATPPSDATLVGALRRTSLGDAFAQHVTPSRDASPMNPLFVVVLALATAVFGWLVGARAPAAAKAAARVIPGGPRSLGAVGPVLGAIFVAALFAFSGADRVLSSIAAPPDAKWFGLELIAQPTPLPSRGWAWVFGVGYVAVHAVGVLLDRARDRLT
jgi:hypothetical protein